MLEKNKFIVKIFLKKVFHNKLRVKLTIVGIAFGLFLFTAGNEVINTYINNELKKTQCFDRNTLIISSDGKLNLDELAAKRAEIKISKYESMLSTGICKRKYNNKSITIEVQLNGCSNSFLFQPIFYEDGYGSDFAKSGTLLYGDNFSKQDYTLRKPKVIIEKSTSILLFGKKNSIGKKIRFKLYSIIYELEVSGVIADLPNTISANLKVNKELSGLGEKEIYASCRLFTPDTWLSNQNIPSTKRNTFVCSSAPEKYQKDCNFINEWLIRNRDMNKLQTTTYMDKVEKYNIAEKGIKAISNTVLMGLILISGFIIMLTLTFSIKERITEIGIRRALGADAKAIMLQFMLEGIIVSITSWFVNVLCCVILFPLISAVSLTFFFITFNLELHLRTILSALFISIIEGVAFSVIPAVHASKIKPIDAIRFD